MIQTQDGKFLTQCSLWQDIFTLIRMIRLKKKNYYIKSNIFDLKNTDKNFYFNSQILWSKEVDKVYKKMFDINLIKKKINKFEKLRFNLSYLLCLMRGINSNYEEKITFFKNKNNLLQNNGIFFSLLAIKYAHQTAYEE